MKLGAGQPRVPAAVDSREAGTEEPSPSLSGSRHPSSAAQGSELQAWSNDFQLLVTVYFYFEAMGAGDVLYLNALGRGIHCNSPWSPPLLLVL